tara:strand:+ start:206 stop:331 length:126 start_codon:yes stop_codon:yes gene_type:complete
MSNPEFKIVARIDRSRLTAQMILAVSGIFALQALAQTGCLP